MVIKTTTWSPDTCDCIIEQGIDDSLPENEQTLFGVNVIRRCTAHQNFIDPTSHFNVVNEENPRKNKAIDELIQNAPSTNWYDIDPVTGSRTFKNGITVNLSWSGIAPNRVLTITFTGITLTGAQRNSLQTRLNNRFGTGKVVLG
jgi:hypothetical protein